MRTWARGSCQRTRPARKSEGSGMWVMTRYYLQGKGVHASPSVLVCFCFVALLVV